MAPHIQAGLIAVIYFTVMTGICIPLLMMKSWSDGRSSMLFALLASIMLIPASLFERIEEVFFLMMLVFGILAMAFFWSALLKSRCRDIWAWISLVVGLVSLYGAIVLVGNRYR